eukprot:TRINITY_DN12610_c0_g1_i1.p1 TRINITY_DN12610_c0_g1~~TRINITY_DN12610_c0_g1_i1.p1  ORF type:complete len:443 (-),score=137.58 TRINITY_DN12610_c0_g1_i1:210-1538(-)
MYRWKVTVFLTTSFFLLCLEVYGRGRRKLENEVVEEGERSEHEYDDDMLSEEDFPSLREWMDDRQLLYKERGRVVMEVCQRYKVKNTTSNNSVTDFINMSTHADKAHLVERVKLSQFFLSRPEQVVGCLINKVASSSIVKSFLTLDGFAVKDVKSPHAYANRLHPKSWDELKMVDENYLKFLIVRDPLERLVSCYKDKMVSNTHWSLANFRKQVKQRAKIIRSKRMNRMRQKQASLNSTKVKRSSQTNSLDMANQFWNDKESFSEFNKNQSSKNSNISSPTPTASQVVKTPKSFSIEPKPEDIPTFSDFLEYILSTDLMGTGFSSHWVPYWRACTPCHFQYSVIAKLETGEDDLTYIWRKSGLESQAAIPWENKSKSSARKKELVDFYSSIPRSMLLRVFMRYRMDYEMFGYDINTSLKLGGHKLASENELELLPDARVKHI